MRSLKNYDKEILLNKLKGLKQIKEDQDSDLDDIYNNFVSQLSNIIDEVVLCR